MNATKIKSLALGLLVALSGLSACISYDNQDQYCDADTNPNAQDACPYGDPKGLSLSRRDACPPIQLLDPKDAQCINAPTWTTLWTDINAAGAPCTAAGACHGSGVKGLNLTANAGQAYDALQNYKGASTRSYINDQDRSNPNESKSWILCNLKLTTDGGLTMPPTAGVGEATYKEVQLWAQCGQKR